MNPSFDLRLKSMITSMSSVIVPALDRGNELAGEQARLVIGHLYLLLQQCDHASRFERLERRAALRLGRRLVATLPPAPCLQAAGERLAALMESVQLEDDPAPDTARTHTELLNAAVEALIDASVDDADENFRRASQESILAYGREISLFNRSWFAATRFELAESTLPPIGEMMRQFESFVAHSASV